MIILMIKINLLTKGKHMRTHVQCYNDVSVQYDLLKSDSGPFTS